MRSGSVFFVGPDPLPTLGSGLAAICGDGCGLGPEGAELHLYPDSVPSSQGLLGVEEVRQLLSRSAAALLVWKGSAVVERLAAGLQLPLASSPVRTSRRLENKAQFNRLANAAGLLTPPAIAGRAGPALLAQAETLTAPLVFQLAHGFSGAQTHPAASTEQLAHLMAQFEGQPCRVAEMVTGTPVTVTGVISAAGTALGPPCLQLTGMPALTPHTLGSCGNDFAGAVPQEDLVRVTASAVAEWLRHEGHRGIFGVDMVVAEAGPCWCIEVNPRLVASVPLWTLSARDRGQRSLLQQHLACFGIGTTPLAPPQCHWSQIILYQLGEDRTPPLVGSARGQLGADGTFSPTGPLDLAGPRPGEVALVVKRPSRRGRELARLILEGSVTASDGTLLPPLATTVASLRDLLEPAE